MKLTTKGRYAVTAMLDLALHAQTGPVSLAEISTRQEISLSYLEQLFSRLRKQGLVASTRGPGGGYRVARGLDEVAISEIIKAVNESVDATQCGGKENCHSHGRCLTHDLWEELSQQIENFLSGVSLQNLIDNQNVKSVSMRQDQHAAVPAASPVSGPLKGTLKNAALSQVGNLKDQLLVQRDRSDFNDAQQSSSGRR